MRFVPVMNSISGGGGGGGAGGGAGGGSACCGSLSVSASGLVLWQLSAL